MTKSDLVSEISNKTGIEKVAVLEIVESLMVGIKDSLSKNENVYLRGFGSFIVKHRAEKKARNILKKTSINVPARNVPAFKPADVFKDAVNNSKKK